MEFSVSNEAAKKHFKKRAECPKCKQGRKMFCYKCEQLVLDRSMVPKIDLPIDLVVLKHPKEKAKKSSAWPAQFLSDDVTIVESYAQAKNRFAEKQYKKVAILYPHKESKLIEELSEEEIKAIDAVMAIDCTWHQAKYIIKDLPDKPESNQAFVILKDYKTTFWRQ